MEDRARGHVRGTDDPFAPPATGPLPGPPPRMDAARPILPASVMPLLVLAIVIVAVLAVSKSGPVAPAPEDQALFTVVDDGVFRLTLRPDRPAWGAGEAVTANASLTYLGAAPQVQVWSRGAPIAVNATALEHRPAVVTPNGSGCAPTTLERGVAAWVPWTGDPLPAGTWRLTASATLSEAGCETGPFHALEATVVVAVGPDASASSSAPPGP